MKVAPAGAHALDATDYRYAELRWRRGRRDLVLFSAESLIVTDRELPEPAKVDARQLLLAALDRKSKPIRVMGYRVRLVECETPHFLTHIRAEDRDYCVNIHIWADGAINVSVQTFLKPRPGKTVASCVGWLDDSSQVAEALRATGLCCLTIGESLEPDQRTPLVNAWAAVVKEAGWAFF